MNTHTFLSSYVRIVLFLLVSMGSNSAVGSSNINAEQVIDDLIEPWKTEFGPGLSLAVMLDDQVVLSRSVGLSNLEYRTPVNQATKFHAASLSKQITAFSIFLLEEEGALSTDDLVSDYLPELKVLSAKSLTLKHLLDHTSGLRDMETLNIMSGGTQEIGITQNRMDRLINNQVGDNFFPGAQTQYSNTGYYLLAKIVESVSKMSFSEFASKRIFEPLEMQNSRFVDNFNDIVGNKAESYSAVQGDFKRLAYLSEVVGSTGLQTTAQDLLKWAANFYTLEVGSPEIVSRMALRSQAANGDESTYANGQEKRVLGNTKVWVHGGRNAGYRAFLLRIPEKRFAVSVLGNRADLDAAKLALNIAAAYFPELRQSDSPSWQRATAQQLESLVGDYELYSGTIFSIGATHDGLTFKTPQSESETSLLQIGERSFAFSPSSNLSLQFNVDETGEAQSLYYVIGQQGKLKARKLEVKPSIARNNLNALAGGFYSEELNVVYIFYTSGDDLYVKLNGMDPIKLKAYGENVYLSATGNFPKVEFILGEEDHITSALISGPLADNVIFERVKLPISSMSWLSFWGIGHRF